jgi:hypothetical protein
MKIDNESLKKLVVQLPKDSEVKSPYSKEDSLEILDRDARLKICNSCEFLSSIKFCKKCKCFMPVKTYFKKLKCPIDKW